jgi:hypothetical protein
MNDPVVGKNRTTIGSLDRTGAHEGDAGTQSSLNGWFARRGRATNAPKERGREGARRCFSLCCSRRRQSSPRRAPDHEGPLPYTRPRPRGRAKPGPGALRANRVQRKAREHRTGCRPSWWPRPSPTTLNEPQLDDNAPCEWPGRGPAARTPRGGREGATGREERQEGRRTTCRPTPRPPPSPGGREWAALR